MGAIEVKKSHGILLATLLIVLAVFGYQRSRRPWVPEIQPTATWRKIKEHLAKAGGSLAGGPAKTVRLDGLSADELAEPLNVKGAELRMVEKIWYPILFRGRLDGYAVCIELENGWQDGTRVWLGSSHLELKPLALPDGSSTRLNLADGRDRLASLPTVKGQVEFLAMATRMEALQGGRNSWVVYSLPPLYQRDVYLDQGRIISFAAFRSPSEARLATVKVIDGS